MPTTAPRTEAAGLPRSPRLMTGLVAFIMVACQSTDPPAASSTTTPAAAAGTTAYTTPVTASAPTTAATAATATKASATSATTLAPTAAQPNIIVILADDLGYADVSAYRADRIPTPNIDRIGREGALFTQGYSSAPICSPARAGLLTGRHQQRFGHEYNTGPAVRELTGKRGLDTSEVTMADALRSAGYRTAAIGKWHLGSAPEFYPTNRGFDEYWGFLTGQTNHIRPLAADAVNAFEPVERPIAGDLSRAWLQVTPANRVVRGAEREPVELGDGLLTEQLTEQAVAFIERNRTQPFFLYLAHHAPHTPLQVSRKYFDRFPNIGNRSARVYAGMVSALDDGVGEVLQALARHRLADNTIVVFLADNGCAMYLPDVCSGKPLSGGKLSYLEGGVRVPYLMRWPARIRAGTVHSAPVSSLDLFPTFAAAAGMTLPAGRVYDGIDLISQLGASGTSAKARGPLFWRSQPMAAVREGHWKYIREMDGSELLYDLSTDVLERDDRAPHEAAVVARLRQAHRQWEADKTSPRWPSNRVSFSFEGRRYEFPP